MNWKDRHLQLTGNKVKIDKIKVKEEKKRMRFFFVLHSELTGYYRPVVASNVTQRSEQIAKSAGFGVSVSFRTHNKIDNGYEILKNIKSTLAGRSIGDWFDCTWEAMEEKLRENGLTL